MQQSKDASILWRRLACPGYESARVFFQDEFWNLQGSAVFSDDQLPCRLDYHIACDSRWHTRHAKVAGWVGDRLMEITLTVSEDQRWLLNDEAFPEVATCIDLDLNFSDSEHRLVSIVIFDQLFS